MNNRVVYTFTIFFYANVFKMIFQVQIIFVKKEFQYVLNCQWILLTKMKMLQNTFNKSNYNFVDILAQAQTIVEFFKTLSWDL